MPNADDSVRRSSSGGGATGDGAPPVRPSVAMDEPLADELPLRPTLRLSDAPAIVVALTTRVTGVKRETQDDR